MTPERSRRALIEKAEMFSSFPPHEAGCIAEAGEYIEVPEGEALFHEGEPGNCLYIVESGEIIVRGKEESGQSKDIARFIEGNCFGELDLFSGSPRSVAAYASAETRLLAFPKRGIRFSTFLQEHPELSAQILHKILAEMAGRIRRINTLVTENSPLVQELKKQVYTDKQTGLNNLAYITESLQDHIRKKESPCAVLMIKPDNFKLLNDTWGHDAGDRAIRIMGRKLLSFIEDERRLARYKGNAMAILLPGAGRDEAYASALEIRNFLNHLDVSGAIGGNPFSVTASIGITLFPDHGEKAEELLFKAHELPLEGRIRGGNMVLFPEDRGEGK
jgi:diguanylate cyclase